MRLVYLLSIQSPSLDFSKVTNFIKMMEDFGRERQKTFYDTALHLYENVLYGTTIWTLY